MKEAIKISSGVDSCQGHGSKGHLTLGEKEEVAIQVLLSSQTRCYFQTDLYVGGSPPSPQASCAYAWVTGLCSSVNVEAPEVLMLAKTNCSAKSLKGQAIWYAQVRR